MNCKNEPIIIRLAIPADAPDVAEIMMRSWEVAYKDIIPSDFIREKNATRPEQSRRVITEDNATAYVIQRDGKTVGIMHVASSEDEDVDESFHELHSIYLHPDCYRQGVGTQAMAFAFNIARSLGKTTMIVWVLAKNTNTIKFYESCGFTADGKTKIIKYGKALECIRMRRKL